MKLLRNLSKARGGVGPVAVRTRPPSSGLAWPWLTGIINMGGTMLLLATFNLDTDDRARRCDISRRMLCRIPFENPWKLYEME